MDKIHEVEMLAGLPDFGLFSPGRMLLHETIKDRYLNHVTYYFVLV
ncbi:hypothetical protein bcgnr5376_59140 [Bacillus cereus]